MTTFESLGLLPKLVRAVTDRGYNEPTPVQAAAIPAVLEGRDMLAGSQTGTGKTAAFALPILQRLATSGPRKGRGPRALILTPTRELAVQVEKSVFGYSKGVGVRSTALYGGVRMPPQVAALRRGVGVVVATPGRLLDHAGQGTIDLRGVEVFVLDEADRMLDMGFLPDLKRIADLLPERRQTLLFSATYPGSVRSLASSLLHDPVEVEVAAPNAAAERVRQVVHPVAREDKVDALAELIESGGWEQVLVFARTRHGADRLARQLRGREIGAEAIHGDRSQAQRARALEAFKRGQVRVLVATDVASRGIDIRALPHVVNFELPDVAEDYVHRIGRTARAGAEGDAHSLVCRAERRKLGEIEALLGTSIRRKELVGFAGDDVELSPRERRQVGGGGGGRSGRAKAGREAEEVRERPRSRRGRGRVVEPIEARAPRPRGAESESRGKSLAREGKPGAAAAKPARAKPAARGGDAAEGEGNGRPTQKKKESKAERRARKPKWSSARKRAAKAKRVADGGGKPAKRGAGKKGPGGGRR